MSASTVVTLSGWLAIVAGIGFLVYGSVLRDREAERAEFDLWKQERRERLERMP
ncbi:hypothetical protein LXT21_43740 [Myxococcus sp. K38C18041901]|uniref:hypothetical protein n=1 Tax=Myxococcus guangdongensis TaxID=2906760 RepID=UPI0020A70B53|nr:hypothetical protein [Myxococcus guangdongensis]MCP3065703.1 hypothetical protein [Myxococcus guangdongensis]